MAQVSKMLRSVGGPSGTKLLGYAFWCPGCDGCHMFSVDRDGPADNGPIWGFNGNVDCPTFTPSLLIYECINPETGKLHLRQDGRVYQPRCHLFLTNGKLIFLSDCGHHLAGQTVDLPDWPD